MKSNIYRELSDEVTKHFVTSVKHLHECSELDRQVGSVPKELESAALAFKNNLRAVWATASIPFTLAAASAHTQRLSELHFRNRMLLKADALEAGEQDLETPLSDEQEQRAREKAQADFTNERATETGDESFKINMMQLLLGLRQSSYFASAAEELLRQATVLTWSAFEVLARDVFIILLNQKPTLTLNLLGDQNAKKLFALKELDYELLASYDFDLSHRMGEVFRCANPLTNLPAIRSAYRALFPTDASMTDALQSPTLWLLSKRRHLIVHQRARVDQEYFETTNDRLPLGTLLQISPANLEESIVCVRVAGGSILTAAARKCES